MTPRPRRIPPTPQQRANRILTQTRGAHSAQGAVPAARPVATSTRARLYVPPSGKTFDRLSVVFRIDDMSLIPASPFALSAYTSTTEAVGTSVALNSPDDGGIYTFADGVYAVTLLLRVVDVESADPTFTMRFQAQPVDPFFTEFGCGVRGGDWDGSGAQIVESTSRTYFMPGDGLSGGIFPRIMYDNLDPVVSGIVAEVHVQRIT